MPGTERVFEPLIDGKPSEVLVTMRAPTEARKRAYTAARFVRIVSTKEGDAESHETPESSEEARRSLFADCVLKVVGYEMANGTAVTTGEQLAEHGESVIVYAVENEILAAMSLKTVEKKTSAESSASSAAQVHSIGTAGSAGPLGSTLTGDAAPGASLPRA
jgi:hypothetical protein